jgi:excisionase family DNA binding protein
MSAELDRIAALDKEMLVPTDICKYLGCSAYTINKVTENGNNPFPFPVIRLGRRVKIPKALFLKAMRGETESSPFGA